MIISIAQKTSFVPKSFGNDMEPESTQIVVEHLAPTMNLKDQLVPKATMKWKIDPQGNSEGGETDMVIDNAKIVKKMVTGIKNLTIDIDGKTLNITKGDELYGPGVPVEISQLADEIGVYLQSQLTKTGVDIKN
jgi:hypothetical protein